MIFETKNFDFLEVKKNLFGEFYALFYAFFKIAMFLICVPNSARKIDLFLRDLEKIYPK